MGNGVNHSGQTTELHAPMNFLNLLFIKSIGIQFMNLNYFFASD